MTEFEKAQMLLYGKVYHFDNVPATPPPLFAVLREERRQFAHERTEAARNQWSALLDWQRFCKEARQPERN